MSASRTTYGHTPAPQAIFGYEAMAALLADLDTARTAANQRATVVTDFRSLKRTGSVIGTYSINGGDPSIAPFVFARVRAGQLVPFAVLRSRMSRTPPVGPARRAFAVLVTSGGCAGQTAPGQVASVRPRQ